MPSHAAITRSIMPMPLLNTAVNIGDVAHAIQLALAPNSPPHSETVEIELAGLERRRHLASAAITACTLAALLVCTVIAALFLEVLLEVELKWLVGALFTGSTLALVVGLAYFLREVHLATRTVRIPMSVRKR